MRLSFRSSVAYAGLLALLASVPLTFTACGGGDESGASEGELFTMALPAIPETLDPGIPQGNASNDTYPVWISTLFNYSDIGADTTRLQGPAEIEGELVDSWERQDDGSYEMTLRSAKSAAGNEVTSEDIKWSFERAYELDPIAAFLFDSGNIDPEEPITVVDDKHFILNVTEPSVTTLRVTIVESLPIIDSTEAKKHATAADPWAEDWLAANIATFGPYQLESFRSAEEIRLRANENYWRGVPSFERVVLRAVPDSNTRLQLLSRGEVDAAWRLSLEHFAEAEARDDIKTIRAPTLNNDIIYLRMDTEPFSDVRVRKAISAAIDSEALVEGAYSGIASPALYQLDNRMPYPPPPPPEPFVYDPAAARQLLADAGYPDGFSFTLVAHPGRPGPQAERVAVLVKDQLAEVGITANIDVVASSADFEAGRARVDGTYEAWIDQYVSLVPDPAYHAGLFLVTDSALNLQRWSNPRVDELAEITATMEDGPERDELLRELHVILEEFRPVTPLVQTYIPVSLRENIEGFYPVATLRIYPHRLSRGD